MARNEPVELHFLSNLAGRRWKAADAARWMVEDFPLLQDVLLHGYYAQDQSTRQAFAWLADDVFQLLDAAGRLQSKRGSVAIELFRHQTYVPKLALILAHAATRDTDCAHAIGKAYAPLAELMREYLAAGKFDEVAA